MGSNDSSSIIISFSIAILLLLVLLLLISYNSKCNMDNVERFEADYSDNIYHDSNESTGNYVSDNRHQKINSVAGNAPVYLNSANGDQPMGTVLPQNTNDNNYGSVNSENNVKEGFSNSSESDSCDPSEKTCFNRDRLTSADLLPSSCGNSKWGEMNPLTGSLITDQNFLTAGHHIGINTIGQSLRNANLQLRSEPPNPQIPVSPWGISTIEPDVRQYGFEIGSAASI